MNPQSRTARIAAKTLRCLTKALAVSVAALSITACASASPTRFALTCIGTETGTTINFAYRWGTSGEWTQTKVGPGEWNVVRWNYDHPGEDRSPTLYIRYDDDISAGVNMVRQSVESFSASTRSCSEEGYTYNFRVRGGELFLDDEEG